MNYEWYPTFGPNAKFPLNGEAVLVFGATWGTLLLLHYNTLTRQFANDEFVVYESATHWARLNVESDVLERLRTDYLRHLNDTGVKCICWDGNPENYEGPQRDCLVHGEKEVPKQCPCWDLDNKFERHSMCPIHGEWIRDRLPKKHQRVYVLAKNGRIIVGDYGSNVPFEIFSIELGTPWQPAPPPL